MKTFIAVMLMLGNMSMKENHVKFLVFILILSVNEEKKKETSLLKFGMKLRIQLLKQYANL